ncbi:MAG TPA: hypothetical protein VGT06_05570 [Candidatus Methylomirabilis sp.]|nr:hypothetical protein [Candidatus Methylomirabilis sp.]
MPVTLEEVFRETLRLRPAPGPAPRLEGTLTFLPELQSGYPGTAHGGAVTAAIAEAGARLLGLAGIAPPEAGALTTSAALRKPLPLGTAVPVAVALEAREPSWRVAVRLGPPEGPLVEGELRPGEPIRLPPGADLAGWGGRSRPAHPVPGLEWCLACGSRNPLGLQLRFDHDATFVWKLYEPRAPYQGEDGRLFRGFPHIALDEIGWWLGALRAQEVGVSTRLEITVQGRAANGTRVLLWGKRQAVVPADRKGRSWLAPAYLVTEAGEPLAAGLVTFAASRAYAPALIPPLAAGSAPEAIRRVFPQYAPS